MKRWLQRNVVKYFRRGYWVGRWFRLPVIGWIFGWRRAGVAYCVDEARTFPMYRKMHSSGLVEFKYLVVFSQPHPFTTLESRRGEYVYRYPIPHAVPAGSEYFVRMHGTLGRGEGDELVATHLDDPQITR